jgi:NDP-hexose-3-ketoreductase
VETDSKQTRWAILGIGRVTRRMVDAVRSNPRHQIRRVAGRDETKLQAWQREFGADHIATDFQKTISAPDVDAVYIALPPSLHAEWSIRALEQGKRVLCEKPLATTPIEARAMLDAARTHRTPLVHATGFVHHPRSHAMKRILQSGELGDICRITVACSFSGITERPGDHRIHREAGGGCLLDLGWYCVFSTLWLTGQSPGEILAIGKRIAADNQSSLESMPWMQLQAISKLDGGAVASWDCGFDAAGRKWIEIAGTKASLICDDFLRPWDPAKPRYWVHGTDGKARAELVGENCFQESNLLDFVADCSLESSLELLTLGVQTQSILKSIDQAASSNSDSGHMGS